MYKYSSPHTDGSELVVRNIKGVSTPKGTLQVTRQGENFDLEVIFAGGQRKTATITTLNLKALTHEGATVKVEGVIRMRRDAWRFGRGRGRVPQCVYMYFPGEGRDLIVVLLQPLLRATGVKL